MTTGDNDEQAVINLQAEELGTGKRYVKGVLTLTTAGGDAGAIALASQGRFTDAVVTTSYGDLASVGEIVA
jgi:hypothetical protein